MNGTIINSFANVKKGHGTNLIVRLEDNTEVCVFVNTDNFVPKSRSVIVEQNGEYYNLIDNFDTVEAREERIFALAAKYGVSPKI